MEHYREAERLLIEADGYDQTDAVGCRAAAQVHATLALAAVQATSGDWREDTTAEWDQTFNRATRPRGGETT